MADNIEVKLENHDQQIKSLKHRMDNQEAQDKIMQKLVTSVELLAVNMKNMLKAQEAQGERLAKLESETRGELEKYKKSSNDSDYINNNRGNLRLFFIGGN